MNEVQTVPAGVVGRYVIRIMTGLSNTKEIGRLALRSTRSDDGGRAELAMEIVEPLLRERSETIYDPETFTPRRCTAEYRVGEEDITLTAEFATNRSKTAVKSSKGNYEVSLKFDPPAIDKATLPFALAAVARGELALAKFTLIDPGRNAAVGACVEIGPVARVSAPGNCECAVVVMTVPDVPSFPAQKYYYSLAHDHTLIRIACGQQLMDLVGHEPI